MYKADDPKLRCSPTKPSLVIVEVKTHEIDLNQTWASPSRKNIDKIITDLRILRSEDKITEISESLYNSGQFDGEPYYWSFVFVGNVDTGKAPARYGSVPRIFWSEICNFIHQRIRTFAKMKADHSQWDSLGKALYKLAEQFADRDEFEKQVRQFCKLPATQRAAGRIDSLGG
jgi:hypothetical protein